MTDAARVLIACCRASGDGDPSDLYPDPDSELLVRALAERGVVAEMVSWDDPDVAWGGAELVVVRSTWDSVDRPVEYLRWANQVDQVSSLVNPAQALAWNLDKVYLTELAALDVPVVPTQMVEPRSAWRLPAGEFVVKPSISAGGRETARYGPAHLPAARGHVERLLGPGHTVMIQPYRPTVAEPGEISLVFIEGDYTHAVRKGPVLEAGAGVQEHPWEKVVFLGLTEPSEAELAVARKAQVAPETRLGPLAYSRVDLLVGPSGEPLVLEVELIDPYLSLSESQVALSRLASALARRAQRGN